MRGREQYQGDRAKLNFPGSVKEYAKELEEEIATRGADANGAGEVGTEKKGAAKGGRSKAGGGGKFAYPVGQQVKVLYDDGVWYPGRIKAQRMATTGGGGAAQEEYDILLDDGVTELTSSFPDPDIEIVTDGGDKDHG